MRCFVTESDKEVFDVVGYSDAQSKNFKSHLKYYDLDHHYNDDDYYKPQKKKIYVPVFLTQKDKKKSKKTFFSEL